MLMNNLIFITSLIAWLGLADKPTALMFSDDKKILLTGAGEKSWYLYSTTPENNFGSCSVSSDISKDNSYTFHSNGTFEFDHGQLTEDVGCQGEECCGDFKNMVGTWTFNNFQKGLKVVALHPKDEPDSGEKVVLFNATIELLEEGVLRISQADPETNTSVTIEFRKRD